MRLERKAHPRAGLPIGNKTVANKTSSAQETPSAFQTFFQASAEPSFIPVGLKTGMAEITQTGMAEIASLQVGTLSTAHAALAVFLLPCLLLALAHAVRRWLLAADKKKAKSTTRSFVTGLAPWDQVPESAPVPPSLSSSDALSHLQSALALKLAEGEDDNRQGCTPNTTAQTSAWVEKATIDCHPSLLPSFLAYLSILVLLVVVLPMLLAVQFPGIITKTLPWLIFSISAIMCLATPLCYCLHFRRLTLGCASAPTSPGIWPLSHAVVLISRRTPVERLVQAFESITRQTGTGLRPHVVLAVEAGDDQEQEAFRALSLKTDNQLSRLQLIHHSLTEDEMNGNPLKRSSLARELHETLVHDEGLDPFQIMVTFIDADSILSSTYLANVEANFQQHVDGKRTIYSSALNTYRSLAREGLLSQMYEVMRCHESAFFNPVAQVAPQANYSMTLGFAAEVNFWEQSKKLTDSAYAGQKLEHLGMLSTQPVEAVIMSRSGHSFAERYETAKQQQWAVVECAWQVAILRCVPSHLRGRWAIFRTALMREVSLFACAICFCVFTAKLVGLYVVLTHWSDLPGSLKFSFWIILGLLVWQWVWFWIAEGVLWRRILQSGSSTSLSIGSWILLVACSPLLWPAAQFVFVIVPTCHCLLVAFFRGAATHP